MNTIESYGDYADIAHAHGSPSPMSEATWKEVLSIHQAVASIDLPTAAFVSVSRWDDANETLAKNPHSKYVLFVRDLPQKDK
jgi:hypothetical protein